MSREPDSKTLLTEYISVGWTPDRDNPAYGAVAVTHSPGGANSTTLRISYALAEHLRNQLTELLGERP